VDYVDDFDEEGGGAGGRVKNNDERIAGVSPIRDCQVSMCCGDLAPRDS
jgi:hypothetical protein